MAFKSKPLPKYINDFKIISQKPSNTKYKYVNVICPVCNNEFSSILGNLKKKKSCGCLSLQPLPKQINSFIVIKDLGTMKVNSRDKKRRYAIFLCPICNKQFTNKVESINRPVTKSCGCLMRYNKDDAIRNSNIPKRLRSIYSGMKARCYNKNHLTYKNYGAKNIIICEEWQKSSNFFNWALDNGYKDGLTIDRINSKGIYCPENCQWITMQENIQKRNSVTKLNPMLIKKIRNDFINMTTRDVAKKYNISHRHIMDIKLYRAWNNV